MGDQATKADTPVAEAPVSRAEFEALKAKLAAFVRTYDHRVDEFNRKSGIKF